VKRIRVAIGILIPVRVQQQFFVPLMFQIYLVLVEDVIGMVPIATKLVMCIISLHMVVNIVETILAAVGMVIHRVVVKQIVRIQ
jgi:hypothetical protein